MNRLIACIAFSVLTSAATDAVADKLPKNATPLTPDEVRAIYSGKTAVYSSSDVYFDPNGTTKGIFGKPKATTTFKGTWDVKDNERCMSNKAKGDPKTYTDCNAFWRSEKKIYSLWTVHYDGSKPDKVNGYWTGEVKLQKSGDRVSKKYAAMNGE